MEIIGNDALILLIDLYHLSIPGDLYLNHRFIRKITLKDLSKIYTKYKNYNYNLNNIIKK